VSALVDLAARIEAQARIIDRRLPEAARWRGLIRRELLGTSHARARTQLAVAYDGLARAPSIPADSGELLALHDKMGGGGGFRTTRARVGPPGSRSAPCAHPAQIADLVESALGRARGSADLPPLLAARLHLDLALVHPFADGNGRVARLAASAVLLAAGYRSTLGALVEQHWTHDPAAYRASFLTFAENGDEEAWLNASLTAMLRRGEAVARFRRRELTLRQALASAGIDDEQRQSQLLLSYDSGWPVSKSGARAFDVLRARSAPWPELEISWGPLAQRLLPQLERLRAEETETETETETDGQIQAGASTTADRAPVVSVIVPAYRGADTIRGVLRGLATQDLDEPFEVIVVASGGDATPDIVRRVFPEVILLSANGRLTPGAARNAGVAVSRGPIIAFLADDCVPQSDWIRLRLAAHRAGHALVGGFIDVAKPSTFAGWAQYFAKFWGMQRQVGRRSVGRGPLFHLSYQRLLLADRFDEELVAGEDTAFNHALVAAGHQVFFDAAIRVCHVNDRHLGDVLAAQREQGAAAGELCRHSALRIYYAPSVRGGPWTPLIQCVKAGSTIARYRRSLLGRFLLSSPLVLLAITVRRRSFRRALSGRASPATIPCAGRPRRVSGTAPRRVRVSAIVPAYNEEAAICDCLDSLLAQTLDELEILVIDDGSTDATAAKAESRGVRVLSIRHGGPGAAKNIGVATASGEVVAFIDADHVLERDCLELLCRPILSGASAGTYTREIAVANPENPWADCWTLNRRAARGDHFPAGMPDRWQNFRAIRRDVFLAAGGFDDVGYGEDMTLAPKLGLLADAVPGARMRHRHPDSLIEIWENARWVGRGTRIRELSNVVRRYSLPRSLRRGIRGSRVLGRPRYLLFAVVYDFGVLSSYLETRLGRSRHSK
jgi:glycosyltransferase involved in cell wall biosynthesis